MSKSLFEQNGGTYHEESGYRIPNFALLEESKCIIGICGKRRLDYLEKHRRILYVNLLTSGKLHEHLREIDIVMPPEQIKKHSKPLKSARKW